MRARPASVSRDQSAWLHGQFLKPRTVAGEMAQSKTQGGAACAARSGVQPVDPPTGRLISPIVAAALCIKPRGLLTDNQAAKVDALKSEWPEFAAMRRLAMRFRGILRSKNCCEARRLAEGRASIRPLRDAAVCPHLAERYRRREKCDHGDLEQWPNRRTDQPPENS